MRHPFADIAFTPAVQALQAKHGSRAQYARMQGDGAPVAGESAAVTLTAREVEYLGHADSFFLATVSETGWPYVQHRGGPRGFLRPIGPSTLAFADYRGNQQFVSAGNVAGDARVSLIVMDYVNRRRLKLLGRLRFIDASDADPALLDLVRDASYRARVDRVAVIEVAGFDWNCPQHITQRFTLEEIEAASRPLHERIAALEAEVRAARAGA